MGNFSKTKSTIFYLIFGLLFAVGVVFTFIPMQFGSKDFLSTLGAISKSAEIGNSITAVYSYTENDDTNVDKSINMIAELLETSYGKNSVNVYKNGDSKLKIEIAEPADSSKEDELTEYFTTLAGGKLELMNSSSYKTAEKIEENNATEDATEIIAIDGWKDIKSISTSHARGNYGITVEFTKTGKAKYDKLCAERASIYMYVNGEAFPSANYKVDVNDSNNQNSFSVWFASNEYVEYFKNAFEAGMIPLNMNPESIEIVYNNANDGIGNLAVTYTSIAVCVMILAIAIVTMIKYRTSGVILTCAVLFADFIGIFVIQSMPWVIIGVSGLITLGLTQVVAFALLNTILASVKNEYMLGKSIVTSFEDAFKKSNGFVLDSLAIVLIISLCFALSGKLELVGIGTIMAVSSILTALTILVLGKFLITLSFAYAENNAKAYALPQREEQTND